MRSFILGTDWGEDCDDAVALRILCRHHKAGKIRLLGVGVNTCDKDTAGSVYGFLKKEGVSDVAVGIDRAAAYLNIDARYQARLAKYAPEKSNDDAEDSIRLYRRLIAEAPGKVEIMEIGFLQVLAGAITSQPDDISPKSGIELFSEKVEKVWIMGGKFDCQGGKEYNLSRHADACAAASVVCDKCPVPITFLGWEIGARLITGDELDKNDYLHEVLNDHGSGDGRESWDPMLCLMAIIGDEKKAGYSVKCGTARVDAETGCNYFEYDSNGKHKYVIKDFEDSYYSRQINDLIKSEGVCIK